MVSGPEIIQPNADCLALSKGEKMPGKTAPKDGKKKKAPKNDPKKSDKKKKK